MTRARIGQILGKARERWRKKQALTIVRDELADILRAQGGVMTGRELSGALLSARGSALREPQRSLHAGAVLRAAIETELAQETPRVVVRRAGALLLIAINDHDGEMLADLAEQLGRRADALVAEEPLPSPARAAEALQAIVDKLELPSLSTARLLALAAAASTRAAVSPRLELYPRDLDPGRALKLARGALLGVRELGVDDVRARVRARYPEMEKEIPNRPELDRLLEEAGWEVRWSTTAASNRGAYLNTVVTFTSPTSAPALATRYPTTLSGSMEDSPEVEEAQSFEDKLRAEAAEGGVFIISVAPSYAERVQREIAGRFNVDVYSIEAALLRHLRAYADENGADWTVVLEADATPRGSQSWNLLQGAVGEALKRMVSELLGATRPVLLVRPGLLARYDRIDVIETLRGALERRGRTEGPPYLWLVVPSDDLQSGPRLDDKEVPVLTPLHWRRVPASWIANRHRAGIVPPPLGQAVKPFPRTTQPGAD